MALDFQQVRQQVIEMGEKAPQRVAYLREKQQKALEILKNRADDLEILRDKVQAALQFNRYLRSATPASEALTTHKPLPPLPESITLLAADGSQINPDRHASVDYCLVNVGAIQMQQGSPDSPVTTVRSRLYYDEQMYTVSGRITEQLVALWRDLRERQILVELAEHAALPMITLTDGPLELWMGRDEEAVAGEYKKRFEEYIEALDKLYSIGASAAGYIDRPRGDLLVRLLEIADLPVDELEKAGQRTHRKLLGVTDIDLFRELLASGERSAVFGIQSRSAGQYAEKLALHFFYLNVGRNDNHPYPVRVEIPKWVADDPAMLNDLHAVLIQQCQILGSRTYPYLLHRSHEVAVVTQDEKEQVERMIALEIQNQLGILGDRSHKQGSKDDSQRKGRYGK